jgi:hypothetical protein
MKKLLLTYSLLLTIVFAAHTQTQDQQFTKPDYQKIETTISQEDSDHYYPALFKRYAGNDTTLNHQDYRMLYYGYIFQEDYAPQTSSKYRKQLDAIYQKDQLTQEDFKKIIDLEKKILQEKPFSMRDLNTLAYSYEQTGQQEKTKKIDYKLNLIIETILSSGDGLEEETAWHVTAITHEYDILNVLGFEIKGDESMRSEGVDYIKVKRNQYGISGFHFNISKVLEN